MLHRLVSVHADFNPVGAGDEIEQKLTIHFAVEDRRVAAEYTHHPGERLAIMGIDLAPVGCAGKAGEFVLHAESIAIPGP